MHMLIFMCFYRTNPVVYIGMYIYILYFSFLMTNKSALICRREIKYLSTYLQFFKYQMYNIGLAITYFIQHIVASELKDPICHSDECQIGSFSSEAAILRLDYPDDHRLIHDHQSGPAFLYPANKTFV